MEASELIRGPPGELGRPHNESNGLVSRLPLRTERDQRGEQGWVDAEGTQFKPNVEVTAMDLCNSTHTSAPGHL